MRAADREFLKPSEAADRLGVDRATIYRAVKERTIPSTTIGGHIRIPWHTLCDQADARTVPAKTARGMAQIGAYSLAYDGEKARTR